MSCLPNNAFVSFTAEQRFLVTGASSGIGRAIALRLNSLGATVVANGRSQEKLNTLVSQASRPGGMIVERLDLTSQMSALPGWVTSLRGKYGKFSGLIHSAGLGHAAPLQLYNYDEALDLFDIHLHAAIHLAQGIADRRNNIGRGTAMLFLSSINAIVPMRAKVVYAAAKSALQSAANCMAKELAPQGIRVNCIAPGLVKTAMAEGLGDVMGAEALAQEEALYPFGLGEPDDIASAAAFLLSREAAWITGQTLIMDGGRY